MINNKQRTSNNEVGQCEQNLKVSFFYLSSSISYLFPFRWQWQWWTTNDKQRTTNNGLRWNMNMYYTYVLWRRYEQSACHGACGGPSIFTFFCYFHLCKFSLSDGCLFVDIADLSFESGLHIRFYRILHWLSRTVFSRTFSIVLRPSRVIPACSRPLSRVFSAIPIRAVSFRCHLNCPVTRPFRVSRLIPSLS